MITRLTGILNRILDDEVRLQVGPIEYQVLIAEAVRRSIQMRTGEEITFHISEYLEGNSGGNRFIPRLIGFITESELDFFDLFCTVEKIGVKKALKAMARPVKEIADAIVRQDAKWLSTLPGIGATTAEQIVTTLKRKVMPFTVASPGQASSASPSDQTAPAVDAKLVEDVYLALMGLGLTPAEARNKLDALLTSGKSFTSVQSGLALVFTKSS
ncbi:MAG TPA: Holliday junction branch migration protein RuvA [Gemmataceae bacterium]